MILWRNQLWMLYQVLTALISSFTSKVPVGLGLSAHPEGLVVGDIQAKLNIQIRLFPTILCVTSCQDKASM